MRFMYDYWAGVGLLIGINGAPPFGLEESPERW